MVAQLVYFEEYKTRGEAMNKEKYIKKQKSRKYIEKLIKEFKRARSSIGSS